MDKILVVDDVEDNIKLLQYDLEDDGYKVFTAADGVEALEQAAAVRPDVILLDIMMPRMDGIEACTRLKADPELAHIPILMLSAKDQSEDVIRGLDAGATDYIAKPINYPIVAARVRSAVRAKHLNEKLMIEKERAETALRAKSRFFATMSHEIRTPITAIMGLAEILSTDAEVSPFDNNQAARMVLSNSNYLLEVINNILDLSKAESGKLTVEKIPCSLFEVMRDVASVVELKAIEKQLLFLTDFEYPLPDTIQSDPTRLKQVLINFINNAIKFTDTGSVRVTVRYVRTAGSLELEVEDTGIGMTEEEVSRLFQPFQQANETIVRRFGGTGLGLSISKTIIDKLGGKVDVKSEKGVGTVFRFRIPAVASSSAKMVNENPLLSASVVSEGGRQFSGRVLLVEDEPVNQKLIAYVLSKAGLEVETADCGNSGLEKALKGSFDLILMDMNLPGLDGITVTRELRSKEISIPIVALTATTDRTDIEKLLHAGCEEYVPKPFERAQLFDCLRRYGFGKDSIAGPDNNAANSTTPNIDQQFARLVLDYVAGLQNRFSTIEASLATKDWQELRNNAHRLAGAGLFGFPDLSLIAKLLEEQALKKSEEPCRDLLKRLQQKIDVITASKGISPDSTDNQEITVTP